MRNWECRLSEKDIAVICAGLNITPADIDDIRPNPGRSANNSNYVILVNGGGCYLYRIPGEGSEQFADRRKECEAYKTLAPYKITDEVVYFDPVTGAKISRFYTGSHIPGSDNESELRATMKTLRRLHELGVSVPWTDTLFDRVRRYKGFAELAGGARWFLPEYYSRLDEMDRFEEYVRGRGDALCFTHGDVSINNALVTREFDYPILIDMEFPAMGDAFADVATFCVDADYREEKCVEVLDYYLGRRSSDEERYRLLSYSMIAGLMWYGWAAYKLAVEKEGAQYLAFRNDYQAYIQDLSASAAAARARI